MARIIWLHGTGNESVVSGVQKEREIMSRTSGENELSKQIIELDQWYTTWCYGSGRYTKWLHYDADHCGLWDYHDLPCRLPSHDQIGPLASLFTQVWEANGLSKCRRTLGISTPHSLRPSWTDSSSVQESCCVKLSVTLMTDWRHLEQMEKPKRNVPGNSTGSKWLSYASFVCRG